MDIKITYPKVAKSKVQRNKYLNILRWPLIAVAVICPLINIAVGGKAWSIVVLMSLYMMWNMIFSIDLVEYNRISQVVKSIIYAAVLLILIDVILSPGLVIMVVPIVTFGGLILAGTLFFTDFRRQKQNTGPMFTLIFLALVGSIIGLNLWHEKNRWTFMVMGAVALGLFISCFVVMGNDFFRGIKKRFHIK